MSNYTLCLLLRTSLSKEERKEFLQDLEKTLNSTSKHQITQWGKRDLAYPILKETQADYYLVNFEGQASILANLDKKFKLEEKVLRFLIVKKKAKKATRPSPNATEGKIKEAKATKETKGRERTKAKKVRKVVKKKSKE